MNNLFHMKKGSHVLRPPTAQPHWDPVSILSHWQMEPLCA